jgi:hypothetical protein
VKKLGIEATILKTTVRLFAENEITETKGQKNIIHLFTLDTEISGKNRFVGLEGS